MSRRQRANVKSGYTILPSNTAPTLVLGNDKKKKFLSVIAVRDNYFPTANTLRNIFVLGFMLMGSGAQALHLQTYVKRGPECFNV